MTFESGFRTPGVLAAGFSLVLMSCNLFAAEDDDANLPASLRRGYVEAINGPANDTAYAHGQLGVIRPEFGRASLYVAWRIMHLPAGAVATESHERRGNWLNGPDKPAAEESEIEEWLRVRGQLASSPPAVKPDYYRSVRTQIGSYEFDAVSGHCGAGAYRLATQILRDLVADAALTDADRRTWIAGQDAVFARCSAPASALPALPKMPSARVAKKIRELAAYQQAAALFYGDEFGAAKKEFDAIAAVPDHPMRGWAILGALRCIVRDTANDPEWEAAVSDAWEVRKLRGGDFQKAIAAPADRHRERVITAMKEFDARGRVALKDPGIAEVHEAIRYTGRRAAMQFIPALPLRDAMDALDQVEGNPYAMGALDLFQQFYPRVVPDRPEGAVATELRKHEWFDFIVSVQACAEGAEPSGCDVEHQHALARWQATKDNAWLLAALMTVREPARGDLPAAMAALAVASDRPEWASLQLYAAPVLRELGQKKKARGALEAVLASSQVHKRDLGLVQAAREAL